jgi:isoleucyl-tRNA synthetase
MKKGSGKFNESSRYFNNTYQFFALYANVDGFAFKEKFIPVDDRPEMDRWILSSLNSLVKKATAEFRIV